MTDYLENILFQTLKEISGRMLITDYLHYLYTYTSVHLLSIYFHSARGYFNNLLLNILRLEEIDFF